MFQVLSKIRENRRLRIQALDVEDLGSLMELEMQAFPKDFWSEEIFASELSRKDATINIIKCGSRVVGYVHTEVTERQQKQGKVKIGEIGSIAISEDHKGMGLGAKLLKYGIDHLSQSCVDQLSMQTRLDNVAMKSLAEKRFGFKTSRVQKNVYKDGSSAYEMILPAAALA